jgi:hypothetical protein
MIRLTTFIVFVSLIFGSAFVVQAQEPIGTSTQPLVGGPLVDQQTRRELGLLTLIAPAPAPYSPGTLFPGPVSGTKTCSAELLNDNWAITASHCISAVTSPDQVTLQANWSAAGTEVRKVAKIRSFEWTHNLDIALLMIVIPFPRHPSVKYPELSYRPTSDLIEQRVEAFGRGISGLAFQTGANPMSTQFDGLYRSSDFVVFETSESNFSYRSVEGAGRATAGGDSGGPSYFRVWDDPDSPNRKIVRLLAGVHSKCQTECLAGQQCTPADPWTWVANIPQCTDASVERILNEIRTQMAFVPEKPFEERKPIDRDVIVAKPDIATAPSRSEIKIMTKESPFESYKKVGDFIAAPATPNFSGTWATVTGAGSNYTMTLRQEGNIVNGQYTSVDGAYKGVINGNLSDRTLVYQWSQQDGQKGTGKFTLSEDGSKFEGSWTYSDDPNNVEATWNGTRL